MPTVEIYICKQGQALKDGRIEMSHDIHSRQDAEQDAKNKTMFDKTIDRIAYYQLSDNGDFKNFYTYRNPATQNNNAGPATAGASTSAARPKRKMKAKKKTGWQKIKSSMGIK